MGNGELSTDLALGILPSASAGRSADEPAANPEAKIPEAKIKARRRLRPEPEDETLDDPELSSAPSDQPAHQLDRLA
jgi:hypothetical protein